MDGADETKAQAHEQEQAADDAPTVLESMVAGLDRLEKAAYDAAPPMQDVKTFAREYGLVGARYGLMAALAVASPKEAIKRALGYVEGVEADRQAERKDPAGEDPDRHAVSDAIRDPEEAGQGGTGRDDT